jgi:AAA family ATP:ADP antiporter
MGAVTRYTGAAMVQRVRRFLDVRPGEGWPVAYTFLFIALAVASFTLAKPIRNGLFLKEFGAYKLAYAYVAVPLVLAAFVPVYQGVARRVGQRLVYTASLLFFCSNVLLFWWGFRFHRAPWMAAGFYVWVNCYGVIAPVQAWTFANAVFDTRQARRLFGVVGSGASFGAIIGGLLAQTLVGRLGTIDLLLVLAGLVGAAAMLVNLGWRVRQKQPARPGAPRRAHVPLGSTLQLIRDTPYLRLIATLVFVVAIVTQWTQFQLNLVADEYFAGDADRLTRAFGTFNFVMGVVAFAVQIVATGPLLRNFGIALTILLLPLSLGVGSVLTFIWPVLWAVLLTNTFDQGLRYSIDRATFELLYLPLSPDVKNQVKNIIDLVINRCADAVGGILLLLGTHGIGIGLLQVPGLGFGLRGLAAASFLGTLVWSAVAWAMRKGYVDAVRDSIQQHRVDPASAPATMLDRSATDVLATKLTGGNPDEILYALGLFEMQHAGHLHPAVRGLLTHPSPSVRRRALAMLDEAGDAGAVPLVEPLLRDPDFDTRTEALLFLAHHAGVDPLQQIRKVGDFEEYSIQAGMVAFLCRPGPLQNVEAAGFLLDNLIEDYAGATRESRLEASRLLAKLPATFEPQVARLLSDADPEVRRAAIRAAGEADSLAFLPRLIGLLGEQDYSSEAADALEALGPRVVSLLRDALMDESVAIEARREVPPVLARLGTVEAQEALYANLLVSDVNLRFRVIAALNRLRKLHRRAEVDRQAIEMVLAAEIMGHYRSYQILGTIGEALAGNDPVVAGLQHSMEQERERIFRLTGLLRAAEDVESAYEGLSSSNPNVRANALELLDHVLSPDLRRLLVPLVDPQVSIGERIQRANKIVGAPVESREEAVAALIASDDPWLRSCGVYAVGALRLTSFSAQIDRFSNSDDALLRETVRAAKVRLEMPPPPASDEEPVAQVGSETGVFDVGHGIGGVG